MKQKEKLEAMLRLYLTREHFLRESPQITHTEETIQSYADHSHSIEAEACRLATFIYTELEIANG